jgi:phage tail sheath protein FI
VSVLFGKTTTNPTQRETIVNAHNAIASLFTEFATLTRKDHIHISDPLRYIFVEGRNFKRSNRKGDSELGGFSFSSEIYWPLAHLYSKVSTSYAAMYPTWFKTSDSNSKRDVWIPSSGVAAATIINTSPYAAPAGFTRGVVTGLIDTGVSPTQKQRDLLYKDSFNPVAVFPGEGIVIFGQKTLLNKPSAFDRLNVRRTFLYLEKIVQSFLKYFVFEANTYITRSRLVSSLTPVFDAARAAGGVYDYRVVCDERNNTPTTIDNNELIVDIYIKPTRTAEFIYVNFYATRTSQNFDELISG